MASLGKLTNSICSFTNETTVALFNFNFELSLLRTPLAEFLPVGQALTPNRRQEAESGNIHQTAALLGFLFNDIIPDTPKLKRAFGTRVSEILTNPDINPQGTEDHGPFQQFIGADGTGVWAAATSGDAAISVLLLACMLAHGFEGKSSVSLWAELISERKLRIKTLLEGNKILNPHTVAAAQREIPRLELARWDASVRAFLRRADVHMKFQKTQFALISDNLRLPYSGSGSTFEKVTATWVMAMQDFEKIMDNHPQQVCDRAILLGISSWHIYPNLLIFQEKAQNVSFHDPLVPQSAVLSLGMEYRCSSHDYIRWSLALSHSRFYGNPVPVLSNEGLRRVTLSQLWVMALGAVFRQWEIRNADIGVAFDWFVKLGTKLKSTEAHQCPELSWILKLCSAAEDTAHDTKVANNLVKYGWRRENGVLSRDSMYRPFFGLCNPINIRSLTRDSATECGIDCFRRHVARLQLPPTIITLISHNGDIGNHTFTEWLTTRPIAFHRDHHETGVNTSMYHGRNARWIRFHDPSPENDLRPLFEERRALMEQNGEILILVQGQGDVPVKVISSNLEEYIWKGPPDFFGGPNTNISFRADATSHLSSSDITLWVQSDAYKTTWADGVNSAFDEVLPPDEWVPQLLNADNNRIYEYMMGFMKTRPTRAATINHGTNHIKLRDPNSKRRRLDSPPRDEYSTHAAYLFPEQHSTGISDSDSPNKVWQSLTMMMNNAPRPFKWLASWRLLEVATALYEGACAATISPRIIERALIDSKWAPTQIRRIIQSGPTASLQGSSVYDAFSKIASLSVSELTTSMSRGQIFACVAMFESGHLDLDPGKLTEVIALCHEDSIFVSETLLTDPALERPDRVLRHMVGNIGHSGLVLMVSPLQPRVRPRANGAGYVNHETYDYQALDRFGSTSLHLSFTEWKFPLEWENTGEIDQEVFLLESVVSVRDGGTWVADLDVLAIERDKPDTIQFPCNCPLGEAMNSLDAVSVDSWDGLLDLPPCLSVIRARNNWVARLAATSIICQQSNGHALVLVEGDRLCLNCLVDAYSEISTPQMVLY